MVGMNLGLSNIFMVIPLMKMEFNQIFYDENKGIENGTNIILSF